MTGTASTATTCENHAGTAGRALGRGRVCVACKAFVSGRRYGRTARCVLGTYGSGGYRGRLISGPGTFAVTDPASPQAEEGGQAGELVVEVGLGVVDDADVLAAELEADQAEHGRPRQQQAAHQGVGEIHAGHLA